MNRILLSPPVGNSVVLCDWGDLVLAGSEAAAASSYQVLQRFRAESVIIADRGNEQVTLSFTVVKEWPSNEAAFDWWATARAQVPRFGDLSWQTLEGGVGVTRYVRGAAVQLVSRPRLGVTTFTAYTVIGGRFSAS